MSRKEDYLEDIRNRVRAAINPRVRAQAMPDLGPVVDRVKTEVKTHWGTVLLGAVIVFLSIIAVVMLVRKSNDVAPPILTRPHVANTPLEAPGADPRVSSLEDRVRVLGIKQWLLGVAINENAALQNVVNQKMNAAQPFITFDEQWKITTPATMQFSPEQQQELSRWLR